MAAFSLHHRTAEFRALFMRVLADLKTFIGTQNDCLLLASSGTGAMEAAIVNMLSPNEHVLAVSIGNFGDRFAAIARAFGVRVTKVDFPGGKAADADVVRVFHLLDDVGKIAVHCKWCYRQTTGAASTNNVRPVSAVCADCFTHSCDCTPA